MNGGPPAQQFPSLLRVFGWIFRKSSRSCGWVEKTPLRKLHKNPETSEHKKYLKPPPRLPLGFRVLFLFQVEIFSGVSPIQNLEPRTLKTDPPATSSFGSDWVGFTPAYTTPWKLPFLNPLPPKKWSAFGAPRFSNAQFWELQGLVAGDQHPSFLSLIDSTSIYICHWVIYLTWLMFEQITIHTRNGFNMYFTWICMATMMLGKSFKILSQMVVNDGNLPGTFRNKNHSNNTSP